MGISRPSGSFTTHIPSDTAPAAGYLAAGYLAAGYRLLSTHPVVAGVVLDLGQASATR
jgi:hypothetical protein